jgi:hypothetical protein
MSGLSPMRYPVTTYEDGIVYSMSLSTRSHREDTEETSTNSRVGTDNSGGVLAVVVCSESSTLKQ